MNERYEKGGEVAIVVYGDDTAHSLFEHDEVDCAYVEMHGGVNHVAWYTREEAEELDIDLSVHDEAMGRLPSSPAP